MRHVLKRLQQWMRTVNMIPCKCGSRDDHWNVKDRIDGHVCEAEVICDNCGTEVNYWGYGYYEKPETYTKLIKGKFYPISRWLRNKFSRDSELFP